jgi:hypothetical protein
MQSNLKRAGLFALLLSFIVMLSWEVHLRNNKVSISYDDNDAMWADKRALVYQPADHTTVFIGSSRIKYDLDIPTWERLTGTKAVQLANVGSSPRAVLSDLANDPDFKGNLIVDITEGMFFSERAHFDRSTAKKIQYYKDRTPTQRFSFQVNHILESQFVFLDQDNFSINAMLDNMDIPSRPGVGGGPGFPREFEQVNFDRQSYMTPEFIADTNLQKRVSSAWASSIKMGPAPIKPERMTEIFNSVKSDVDKIKGRGGKILFVRTPSSGPFKEAEMKGFPRAAYWDRLLKLTDCPGIYFTDYPATASFVCPEWSHLKPSDAIVYTKSLVKTLKEEKGWF